MPVWGWWTIGIAVYIAGMCAMAYWIGKDSIADPKWWHEHATDGYSKGLMIIFGLPLWTIALVVVPFLLTYKAICRWIVIGEEKGRQIAASREFNPGVPVVEGEEK
jgi:hypothetical protein